MDTHELLRHIDHTVLNQTATLSDIESACADSIEFRAASICIPPSYVKDCVKFAEGKIPVCTVIGFPNGYSTTEVKCFEAADATTNGAEEIDMVINLGWIKDKKFDEILSEIRAVRSFCDGAVLKVIIETCFLSKEEKIELCRIVSASSADFIKTSTGFGSSGAAEADIELMRKHLHNHVKIKAAGGIRTVEAAERFISLGADRIGSSALIGEIKNMNLG